ncbi:MAG: VWA domain-containing protein [Anaerolineales bacterium]|nr:VWA domain-containing protein [Anaerolineales bacterium]
MVTNIFQRRRDPFNTECGQAMILIAGAFIGLVALVGLVVDGGILFTQHGQLRRAVDTSALSAANEFRLGQTREDIARSARELIALNMPEADVQSGSTSIKIDTCDDVPLPDFCPATVPRKFVRVAVEHDVQFVFLPIIGIHEHTIYAEAIGEAASIDLVLVIDTSESMAFDVGCDGDDDDGDGVIDDGCGSIPANGPPDDADRDPTICNPAHACYPFEDVRQAAKQLLDYMYFPYDRVAVVTFDRIGYVQQGLTSSRSVVDAVLNDMQIFNKPRQSDLIRPWMQQNCPDWGPDMDVNNNPTGCLSTNSGDGLRNAGNQLRDYGREEAVWVVIFLSDGIANTANVVESTAITIPPQVSTLGQWICPESTQYLAGTNESGPFCIDGQAETRHQFGNQNYDAEDFARDMADWLACPQADSPAANHCIGQQEGLGAVIFSVGLGDRMINARSGKETVPYTLPLNEDLGERLLRYMANVGYDGNPNTEECSSAASGTDCGNYYYAASGADVAPVFEAIAQRIFTRIVH